MSDDTLSIFKKFSSVDQYAVNQFFPHRTFAAGESACQYGEKGTAMQIILSGNAEVRRPMRREGEFEVVTRLEVGQVFGESSLVGQHMCNATVVAVDELAVLVVNRADMERFKKEQPVIAFALYEGLLEQIIVRFSSLSDKKNMLNFWLG